eukprot:258272_1
MFLLTILTIALINDVSFAGHFILGGIFTTPQTWEDAEALCLSKYNQHLASIHSEEDNEKVKSICKNGNNGIGNLCWIGLKNVGNDKTDGIFKWSDGTNFDYSNWAVSNKNIQQPDFSGDCVLMTMNHDGAWNDRGCNTPTYKYICNAEIPVQYLHCYVGDQKYANDNTYIDCGRNQNRCLYTENSSGGQTIYERSCSNSVECTINGCQFVNSGSIRCCCANNACNE